LPRRPTGKRSKTDEGSWLVHGKAANGEGSIYPRADGRWTATFHDAAGRTRTVSARTRELVLAKRAAALEDVRNQAPTRFDRSTTVAALADWWLVNVASTQVRASSLAKYEDRVGRIKNGLGTAAVAELRPPRRGVPRQARGLRRSRA
jgi:integrase